jgi:hypothetical protein
VPRLGQGVLDEGHVRLVRFGNRQIGLRHQIDAQWREQALEFAQLARIVRRQDQSRDLVHDPSTKPSTVFGAVISSRMPAPARSTSRSFQRAGIAPSRTLRFDITPAPVMTTFMSVSRQILGIVEIEQRRNSQCPPTPPSDKVTQRFARDNPSTCTTSPRHYAARRR